MQLHGNSNQMIEDFKNIEMQKKCKFFLHRIISGSIDLNFETLNICSSVLSDRLDTKEFKLKLEL